MTNVQRRVVKSPFTKEQREGVFVSLEEARLNRALAKYQGDTVKRFTK